MLIRLGYEIRFDVLQGATFVALLRVRPSRQHELEQPDFVSISPEVPVEYFEDSFGNLAARFQVPAAPVALACSTSISDSGELDPIALNAKELAVTHLPPEILPFLLNSRYCEVDLLSPVGKDLFGQIAPGWIRVQAICDWVKAHVVFDYTRARPTKTALDVFTERVGVCRDFQHLAITFCRALNIPARYVTGYLGDIGVSESLDPMDFSAWFEVYLDGHWYTFDARHNQRRIGRVAIAVGRDATDVAITTSFGEVTLTKFSVITQEIPSRRKPV